MKLPPFERAKHVYRNDAFVELIKDAVRFFNGTPVLPLPPPESFSGTGVYALYYTGKNPAYAKIAETNRLEYRLPIYVGKAVPKGWRKARTAGSESLKSAELFRRINEHAASIRAGAGISPAEFACRFVIFESASSDMIGTVEAALIKLTRPLWNSAVDGFGNHTPGAGRFEQAKSDWDVLHPGRAWAAKCKGKHAPKARILSEIEAHFSAQISTRKS